MLTLMAMLVGGAGAALADVDISEYESKSALSSQREREQMRREIEAERTAEQQRATAEAQREARLQEQAARRLASRPYPERLLEARCTACHSAANYLAKRHTVLGWWLVMLRMRYLNGAVIEPVERRVILGELVRRHGPTWVERVTEFGALALAFATPPLIGWAGRRFLRRRNLRRPG